MSRPLTGTERVWLVADRLLPPFVNQLVVEGDGALDVGALRAAVASASAVHPGARLALRGWLRGARWVAQDAPPPVVAVDGGGWDGTGPDGAPFLMRPLPPREGPTVELLVVSGDPPRLVVRSHHAVMDGRGTWLFVEDCLRALRGEAPVGAPLDPVRDVDLARGTGAVPLPRPGFDRVAPTGLAGAGAGARWRRVRYNGEPRGLLARLGVALWRASRRWTDGPLRLQVPVDLRRHTPELRWTGNLTGMVTAELDPLMATPDPAAALRARLAEASAGPEAAATIVASEVLRGFPLWLMGLVGRRDTARELRTGEYLASAVFSNLGRQDLAALAAPGFQPRHAFWIPPAGVSLPLFLAASGDPEGVDLVAAMPVGLASDGRLEALLADLVAQLDSGQGL